MGLQRKTNCGSVSVLNSNLWNIAIQQFLHIDFLISLNPRIRFLIWSLEHLI